MQFVATIYSQKAFEYSEDYDQLFLQISGQIAARTRRPMVSLRTSKT